VLTGSALTRNLLLAWMVTLTVCSCGGTAVKSLTPSAPAIEIHEVVIRNLLPYPIKNVQILAPATGNFVSCGNIFQQSQCSTTFPVANYSETPVQISWTEWDAPRSMPPIGLNVPEAFEFDRPATIEVTVYSPGQAAAKLIQEPRD
jgi:hypothetical protein